MAAQTDAPDDLIAELARLMADDAKATPAKASDQLKPVRIPGDAAPAPVPRFDFSASSGTTANQAPSTPVRIPGAELKKPEGGEAFAFNFDLGASPAAPSATSPTTARSEPIAPVPQSVRVVEPEVVADETAMLDQDSLADLIAAELAADMGPAREEPPVEPLAPTPRPASSDNFGVPPVFGLGSGQPASEASDQKRPVPATQPAATTPAVFSPVAPVPEASQPEVSEPADPLDEIERLVGPAVRMNAAGPTVAPAPQPTPAPSPAPTLRSLATPVLPEPAVAAPVQPEPRARTSSPTSSVEVSSVDEAILAAAAATGAHVEWVNAGQGAPSEASADDFEPMVRPPRAGFRMSRAVAGPLVAVALLAVAGGGLYWVLGQGGTTSGPAPLLVADTTPTKEVPEVDTTEPAPQSVVFNEISGANTGADEQIVSRDQADTDAVVAANTPPAGTSGVIAGVDGTEVDPNQDGLVNRKVRTVTVRPDGTIISGNDSLAGSAILPVDRPNVPDVPGADFSTPDLIANASAEAATATATTATETAPTTPAVPAVTAGSSVPVVDAAGAPLAGRTVTIPMDRPADFATAASSAISAANAAPTATTQPLAAPAATPTVPAATTTTGGTAAAYVQLASQRSEAEAQQTAQAVSTRYGVLFGGASPEIRRVDLGERGIYYRVLVPAPSRESAANICTNVRAAGGECLLP
ncbi:Sporulation related domain-containing protein [Devosia lucknowensis]|uniref:Sporulation related domain-containing protein n=1 Tax=Devosia lucknowensis TaxID=1096929 RepID=A0A1Y6EMZ3_9HYPH|nr:SPOR domain-containing protein [Devosia lucknowensis]SMQ63756.1 Sporulation related domain-containing protein [Devosia lucknowensis]